MKISAEILQVKLKNLKIIIVNLLILFDNNMNFFLELTTKLWKFLKGNPEEKVPDDLMKFIQKRSSKNTKGHFSVGRNSLKQSMSWRKEFNNQVLLSNIEQNCQNYMKELGYMKLHSITQVKQIKEYPSVTESCSQIPCL